MVIHILQIAPGSGIDDIPARHMPLTGHGKALHFLADRQGIAVN
jgi:hypothetical protein